MGLKIGTHWTMVENSYNLEEEAANASLLTTSNGYIGVRGSLEEFGSLRIQGCYIRGLIDEVNEIIEPFADNIYMKKYYLHEEKLKDFQKQECVINYADILLVRITIGGETFYPWEGKILSWKRTLDMKQNSLVREVTWENSQGDITALRFERFASFEDDHTYCIQVKIIPRNHSKKIEIMSGLDLRTKTSGQRVTKKIASEVSGNKLFYQNYSGDLYKFIYCTGVSNHLYHSKVDMNIRWYPVDDDAILANTTEFDSKQGETYTLEKKIYVATSREVINNLLVTVKMNIKNLDGLSYVQIFEKHKICWQEFFDNINIEIEGDKKADASLRFTNYHTAISIAKNDSIHGVAAKGLTGERYNNFVWWDCEVYQLPIFFYTVPEVAKKALIYRYNKLDAARELAKSKGRRGARYPFISSVTGLEKVWDYVRHPFMQIHISADVAWGVINYYNCTGDREFLLNYGLEILWEIARYWETRIEFNQTEDRYEIKKVTGTDEHHPYVNNDAYTNYLVNLVVKYAVSMYNQFRNEAEAIIRKISLSKEEVDKWEAIRDKLYLPLEKETGLIPQFDGYYNLNKYLETVGGSTAKSFQMKQSGLYNESQIIKQPDVMLLFSYLNLKFNHNIYARNWDYYEHMCETSSSLSYPVHSVCASDMNQPESAYRYFLKTSRIDLDDVHQCAWQGIHSGCAAGAWYSVVRGVAGIKYGENGIEVNPHMIPWWKEVSFNIVWHGQKISVKLTNAQIVFLSHSENQVDIHIRFNSQEEVLKIGKRLELNIVENFDPQSALY